MKKIAVVTALLLSSNVSFAYDNSYMGEIIGGIAGGVIGNQIGGGSGKVVTTAIGAAIGSQVGGRVEDSMRYNRQPYGYGYGPQYAQPQYVQPQYGYAPQQQYYQPRQVVVVPAHIPTPLGYRCELQSVYVNGQVVLNNYCY
jgi:hypothetical protein